ncbi:MAG: superinfection immunity protein [Puniceicoccales bacterium]|nr:superinfection immunity protein [Puniceicoccales bacterium]
MKLSTKLFLVSSFLCLIWAFAVPNPEILILSADYTLLSNLLLLPFVLLCFYAPFYIFFLPSIIAKNRNHKNTLPIFLFNLFFGCTGLGWILALMWATTCNTNSKNTTNKT